MNKLYKKDSNGNIRVWWAELDGGNYRTVSGVHGGSLVTSEWQYCPPKNIGKRNETSAIEQAELEVDSLYRKKLKTGYTTSIQDIENVKFKEVMLAKKFDDYKDKIDWSKGVLVQLKFNGHRCIITKDGAFTRKGERYYSIPHITAELRPFFDKYPDAMLDGELFNFTLRSRLNELSSIVRKTVNLTNDDFDRSRNIVQYHIYDGYNCPTLPYSSRMDWINSELVSRIYCSVVDSYECFSIDEVNQIYYTFIDDDHEGVIIRFADSPYEHKRSKLLLKYKPVDDAEFEIVDIIEGVGNWAGTGKKITFRDVNGKEFSGSFKGTHDDCRQFLLDRDKWIGKTVTVEYNGLTGLGTPNYARMDINNCLKG